MESENFDSKGNFHQGQIFCDGCHKTLFTYFSEEEAPSDNRDSFVAVPVEFCVVAEKPTNIEVLKQFQVSMAFEFEGAIVGYRFPSKANYMIFDFCSLECAYAWLERQNEYGLLCYGHPSRQMKFMRDNPNRFETKRLLNNKNKDVFVAPSDALYSAAINGDISSTKHLLGSRTPYYLFELYFDRYPFGSQLPVLTFLSFLPPRDRVVIIKNLLNKNIKNGVVYEKLALALLKNGQRSEAYELLTTAISQGEISRDLYHSLIEKLNVMDQHYQGSFGSSQVYAETIMRIDGISEDFKNVFWTFLNIVMVFCKIQL